MAPSISDVAASDKHSNGKVAPGKPKAIHMPVNPSSADAIQLDNEHGAHK